MTANDPSTHAHARRVAAARAMVRASVSRRAHKVARAAAVAVGVCVLSVVVIDRTDRWKAELLRTGQRTTGVVTSVDRDRNLKGAKGATVLIAVTAEPPFETRVRTDAAASYREGERVTVFFDPANRAHARTERDTTGSDWPAGVAIVVAVVAGIAVLASLVAALQVLAVFALGRHYRVTVLTTCTSRRQSSKWTSTYYRFADTAHETWVAIGSGGRLAEDRPVVVGGRRRWRVLCADGARDPVLIRQLRQGIWLGPDEPVAPPPARRPRRPERKRRRR